MKPDLRLPVDEWSNSYAMKVEEVCHRCGGVDQLVIRDGKFVHRDGALCDPYQVRTRERLGII